MSEPDLGAAAFILWLDYGYEGWKPTAFASLAEAQRHVADGQTYGNPFVITGPVVFPPADAKEIVK